MRGIEITPYEMASRFKGIKEIEGGAQRSDPCDPTTCSILGTKG